MALQNLPARNIRRKSQTLSIFHMMDERGDFAANPANPSAIDDAGLPIYKGPVKYPRMVYHPQGATRITNPAEIVATLMGPKEVGERRELISRVINDVAEEREALAEGWHLLPADAIAASGKPRPPVGRAVEAESELSAAQAENEKLKLQLAELQSAASPPAPPAVVRKVS